MLWLTTRQYWSRHGRENQRLAMIETCSGTLQAGLFCLLIARCNSIDFGRDSANTIVLILTIFGRDCANTYTFANARRLVFIYSAITCVTGFPVRICGFKDSRVYKFISIFCHETDHSIQFAKKFFLRMIFARMW